MNNGSHDYDYVKGVTHSDGPTENDHPTLQLPSAPQSFITDFIPLFWFSGP